MKTANYPLHLPSDLALEVEATVRATGLNQAEAMRQALKIGLPQLRETLPRVAGVKLVNVLPWSSAEIARDYRDKRVDNDYIVEASIRGQTLPKD